MRERVEGSEVDNVDDHDMFTNGKCSSNSAKDVVNISVTTK